MSNVWKILFVSGCLGIAVLLVRGGNVDEHKDTKGDSTMTKQADPMDKFDFLIGTWHMEYTSHQGSGTGTFQRALDGKYVFLDYSASSPTGETGGAHGIFAWDPKYKIYRYWWFENSGNFTQATCNFINEDTLLMHWEDTLLNQTFQMTGPDKVELKMNQPDQKGNYKPILEVTFTKQ